MSLYEQRLTADKDTIRRRVVAVGRSVEARVAEAVAALIAGDIDKCYAIVLRDLPINREIRGIDQSCHAFVARHLPSAGHLRFVSSVLQMNVALERVGDYAVTIAREGVQLSKAPDPDMVRDLTELSEQACSVLHRAITAFANRDAELARDTREQAKQVEQRHATVIRSLAHERTGLALSDALAYLMVFNRIDRVSDQARNICEETVFEVTGETKPPKRYSILFVDADNTLVAPLAVALARKAFPESGHYQAAGHEPGAQLAPELLELAEELGLDLPDPGGAPFDATREALEKYHVVVALSPEARQRIGPVPYATVLLEWPVSKLQVRELAQDLASKIQELMTIMRGENAA